jgi:DNA-binding transcriptional LysR family regulator
VSERLLPPALHCLDHVARCGSIHGAARDLNIAASAIDRRILALEAELGVALFERLPRGMRLTVAGDIAVTLARRWRGDIRRMGAEIRQLEGINQGHLRLVAMDSHANGILPRLVERLRREHPKITLEIEIATTDQAVAALVGGSADLGLIFNLSPHRDIRTIWNEDLPLGCIVAPGHELAAESAVSLQRVASYPIVLQGRGLMIRRYLETRHGWLFERDHLPVETNSLQLVKMLVRNGNFIALTSELDAGPEILAGSLKFIPVRDKAAEAQTISVAGSARLPLPRIGQIVAGIVADEARAYLALVRGQT